MTVPDAVTQFRWDYVMESGIRALTLALALRLPGDYLPLEGPGVTDQQESVAGLSGHSLLTAYSLKCGSRRRRPMEREGVRKSVAGLPWHSLAAKGGNGGCWSGCLGRSAAESQTDRRASTASFIDPGIGTAAGTRHHRPGSSTSAQTLPSTLSTSGRSGHGGQEWTAVDAMFFDFLLAFRAGIAKFVRL